jgi:hypothetical protein
MDAEGDVAPRPPHNLERHCHRERHREEFPLRTEPLLSPWRVSMPRKDWRESPGRSGGEWMLETPHELPPSRIYRSSPENWSVTEHAEEALMSPMSSPSPQAAQSPPSPQVTQAATASTAAGQPHAATAISISDQPGSQSRSSLGAPSAVPPQT